MFNYLLLIFFPTTFIAQNLPQQERRLYNIIIEENKKEEGFDITYEVYFEKAKQRDEYFRTASLDTFLLVLYDDLSRQDKSKNDLLVYIHGMWGGTNHMFRQASHLMHEAYVDHEDASIARILSVKWPGNTSFYKTNKEATFALAPELQQIFDKLFRTIQVLDYLDYQKDYRISLLAHSLGNEIIKEFFNYYSSSDLQHIYFDEIILAAPDLDDNLFEAGQLFANLHKIAGRTHIYFSRKDITLNVSLALNAKNRLGVSGPSVDSIIEDNIFFVDVSEVKDERNLRDRLTGHSYYRISEIATTDMRYILSGKECKAIPCRTLENEAFNIYKIQVEEAQP